LRGRVFRTIGKSKSEGDSFSHTRGTARQVRINGEQHRQKIAVISAATEKSEVTPEEPCIAEPFRISSALPRTWTMYRLSATAKAIFAALTVTFLQIAMAVLLLAPEGPLPYRYQTLVQHDSYWFANIVDRGYRTIVPPISHKMMEVSNTAFFPAYPAITAALRYGFGFRTETALLVTAQSAACGFWAYFFLFCARWNIPGAWQFFGAVSIAAHPAAFFLIAAYSESLFMMALLGFLYWSGEETGRAKLWAMTHGVVMCGTRIVGLPCALTPLAKRIWEFGWRGLIHVRDWFGNYGSAFFIGFAAMLGGLAFFAYCQLRFGSWNIYMLTQQFGWGIEPDYSAVFRPSNYRWLIPALENPTQASQMAMTLGAIMLLAMITAEFVPRLQRPATRSVRIAFYFAAAVLFFVSVSGVACVAMESMLRYEFCVHALIVLALLHYLHNVPLRSRLARASAVTAIALISAAGLGLESWYVWNFTRGNWVA